jgi:hypothetical protein
MASKSSRKGSRKRDSAEAVSASVVEAVGIAVGTSSASAVGELLWSSLMVGRPEFVQAIGMMGIEIAEMEMHLARILGRLLNSSVEIGEAVYFTLKANTPRIELVQNVAPLVLAKNPEKLKAVTKAADKAIALMGQRHNLVHNRFEVDGTNVFSVKYKKGVPVREPIELKGLTNLVEEIRRLNVKLLYLADYGSTEDWRTS